MRISDWSSDVCSFDLAFVFGVLPLAVSTGAGAGGPNAIGRSVVGGMLSATIFAIFFVPLFFVIVARLFKHRKTDSTPHDPHAEDPPVGRLQTHARFTKKTIRRKSYWIRMFYFVLFS